MEVDGTDDEGSQPSRSNSPSANEDRRSDGPVAPSESASRSASDPSPNDSVGIHSPGSPFPLSGPRSQNSVSVASLLRQPLPDGTRPYSQEAVPLTQKEALLVHYYSEHLGRWLDCTDATRQFTLGVPEKVKYCPVLCHAVLSFAARHRREDDVADAAYQRCIALLIDRLNEPSASHDETLLCAIVILRFYEQLNGELHTSYARILADMQSTFHYWLGFRTASSRLFCDTASFPGQSLRRSIGANAPGSCFLGLCSSVSIYSYHQSPSTRCRLLTAAAPDTRLDARLTPISASEAGDCLG